MAVNLPQQEIKESEKKQESIVSKINNYFVRFSRVPLREKLVFVQHLGIMLKAGIALSSALKTLAEQSDNKRFIIVLNDIANKVDGGVSLADSLKSHQDIFGELFVSMVDSGEVSGNLESVLKQLFVQLKKQNELISKVKGALTYPVVIIFAMFAIGTFMMIYVVPKITSMMKEFNAELPLPTKIIIAVSDGLVNNGVISAISFAVFIFIIVKTLRTYRGKYYFQKLMLKMPVVSSIIKKYNLAKFSRTISSLLRTDMMIIKTFQITADTMGNLHYRQALMDMSEKIKKGGQINDVIRLYPKLFPPVVVQMILVGEQTGELDNILTELADFYENEVDQIMNNLPSIIEPLLILFLGVGVGLMAIAIIMPMYSLTSAI